MAQIAPIALHRLVVLEMENVEMLQGYVNVIQDTMDPIAAIVLPIFMDQFVLIIVRQIRPVLDKVHAT